MAGSPVHCSAAPRSTGQNFAAVAVGGFCGAALRVGLGMWFPDGPGFPSTTLGINVAGTAALGALTSHWKLSHRSPEWLRTGIGTGFLGAFTTFSTLILFVLGAERGLGLLDVVLSLGLCVAAGWAAMALVDHLGDGGRPSGQHPDRPEPGSGP